MSPDKGPAPVLVANPDPLLVEDVGKQDTDAQSKARSIAASLQSDADILSTEGQRAINRLWERTQAVIAISIVEVTLVVVTLIIVLPLWSGTTDDATTTAAVTGLVLLSNLVGNVTGAYFARTNHSRVGGVAGTSGYEPQRRGE